MFRLLLSALLVLLALAGFTQVPPPQKVNSNYQFKAAGADSAQRLPKRKATIAWLDSGAVAYSIPDSNIIVWTGTEWIYINRSNNGLSDSAGTSQLGGFLHKDTKVDLSAHSLWLKQDSNSGQPLIVGDSNINPFGFGPAIMISQRAISGGSNDAFLAMTTADFPTTNNQPNGFLFLNYQNFPGGGNYPNIRMAAVGGAGDNTPFNLDLIGRQSAPNAAAMWTSLYDISTYYTSGADSLPKGSNFVLWSNGADEPAQSRSIFKYDSNYNWGIGPWWGGNGDSIEGSLDIRFNNGRFGIIQRGQRQINSFSGSGNVFTDSAFTKSRVAHPSALVEIETTKKGFMLPRMTTTQKLAIGAPDEGISVYDLTLHQNSFYNGTSWLGYSPTISGSFSGTGTATTVFTVTIGTTQANANYKVNVTPTSALSAALFYVTSKTTTTFNVVYLAGLTGTVTFDWSLNP